MSIRQPKEYLVSLILPTRKRVKDLQETLDSVILNSNLNNKNYEIIIKLDYDDKESIDYMNTFVNEQDNISFIVSSRLEGWYNLVDFVETMIDMSKGKYIWNINDDSRILTPNWNDILETKLTEFKIYHPVIEWGPDINGYIHNFREAFPIYPKKLKELWGYLCPHNNIDSWLYFIGTKIQYHPWNLPVLSYIDEISMSHAGILDETSQDKIDQIHKINGTAQVHEDSKELYHAINLLEEHIHYLKWKNLNEHNIINDYRNKYL